MTTVLNESPARTGTVKPSARTAAQQGARDVLPFATAIVPFAFAIGSASVTAELSFLESSFASVALLAGAAQLAAVELIGAGESIALTVLIVTLINLRFVFYSAGLARWFGALSLGKQLTLAIPLVDANFMLAEERFAQHTDPVWRRSYYVAVSAILVTTFVLSQALAYKLGASLPNSLGLHLAAPLCFVGMLVKSADTPQTRIAGVVAATLVVSGSTLLGPAALPVAAAAGVGVAISGGRR